MAPTAEGGGELSARDGALSMAAPQGLKVVAGMACLCVSPPPLHTEVLTSPQAHLLGRRFDLWDSSQQQQGGGAQQEWRTLSCPDRAIMVVIP